MTMTRAQFLILLEPKLSQIYFDDQSKRPTEFTRYFNRRTANKATITDQNMTGFGSPSLKGEGQVSAADDPINGNTKTYQPVRFALKYGVTDEMASHELYGQVQKLESALVEAFNDHQEVLGALWMNNAFVTTNADGFSATGFDSLALCSTAHTRLDGGATWRNRPSTDVDLGITALQAALTDIQNWKSHRGRPVMFDPQTLIISPEDEFTAEELLKSEYKPGVANNDVNALRKYGLSYFISHYKTDTDAWFIQCSKHDLNWLDEKPFGVDQWDAKDEMVTYRRGLYGAVNGHGEPYGIWGTTGV